MLHQENSFILQAIAEENIEKKDTIKKARLYKDFKRD